MKQLLPLALLVATIIFGVIYFTSSMASLDAGTTVQGSEYETAYDDTTDSAITNLDMISLGAYILAVAALVGAISIMRRSTP